MKKFQFLCLQMMEKYCNKSDEQKKNILNEKGKKRQKHKKLYRLYLQNSFCWLYKLYESIGQYGLDIEVERKIKSLQFNQYAKNGGVFN